MLFRSGATTSFGIRQSGVVQSDVTTKAYGILNELSTQAATFTLPSYSYYGAIQGTIGAGSTVTNQFGMYIGNLTGATNNYGIYSNIASGTGRWNFYAAGTADNYFAGKVGIGVAPTTGTLEISAANNSTPLVFGNAGGTSAFLVLQNSSSTGTNIRIGAETNDLTFYTSAAERIRLNNSGDVGIGTNSPSTYGKLAVAGNVVPAGDISYDLGSSTYRWRNVYTGDLHLSNESSDGNEIDGTTGNWTLQEGENDIYMLNNKTGKKYRIKLEEV